MGTTEGNVMYNVVEDSFDMASLLCNGSDSSIAEKEKLNMNNVESQNSLSQIANQLSVEEVYLPDAKNCCAKAYVQSYLFPLLTPALEEMLVEAKNNKVFEKRRTKFNACDFLTTYLYNNNPLHKDSRKEDMCLEEIPFVQELLAINPRPPIPLSLLLSDDEAATIIQSHYRGYQIRKDPEVQELRQYQKEMREEEVDINFRVEDFWKKRSIENVE